jgi:hypothetical protein
MHAEAFIQDLAIIMLVAGIVTLIISSVKTTCGFGLFIGRGLDWPAYATFCVNS